MHDISPIWIAIIFLVLTLVNIPFGIMRSAAPRFSKKWGRCIYIPILLSIFTRKMVLLGYAFVPVFLAATIAGQTAGAFIRKSCFPEEVL